MILSGTRRSVKISFLYELQTKLGVIMVIVMFVLAVPVCFFYMLLKRIEVTP